MLTGINNNFKLLKVGHCNCPEKMAIKNGAWKKTKFPSLVSVIKHHKHGVILFDTGYHNNFYHATKSWPQRFYSLATPVTLAPEEDLVMQLKILGITKDEITYIFISHFHADHIAGLKEFSSVKIICSKVGYQDILNKGKYKGVIKGLLPDLLPEHIEEQMIFIEDLETIPLDKSLKPFEKGTDLFSDKSFIAIDLPGHAKGHFGLLYQQLPKSVFMVGDAIWNEAAYKKEIMPHPLAYLLMDNKKEYLKTIDKIRNLYQNNDKVVIIPSHCRETFQRLSGGEIKND